jgi:hypothetical protein
MPAQTPNHGPKEVQLLALLKDAQHLLAEALNSLGGKSPPTPESAYLGWAAVSVNRAAEGYLWLRESGRVGASKLLVRPALEATFSGVAAIKKPGFLFRKAYSEWKEDKRMFAHDAGLLAEADRQLDKLKLAAKRARPGCPAECKPVTVRDAAEMAGLSNAYESAYRVYCNFTHGAMSAVQGQLDRATDTIDTDVVGWCVLMMLNQLKEHTPAQIPDLNPFKKRLEAIDTAFS